jgi:hypothetical protein
MVLLNVACRCPMKGHPDTQSCRELAEYGYSPIVRPGDVLDGVILVGGPIDEVVDGDPDFLAAECECACHWGAD